MYIFMTNFALISLKKIENKFLFQKFVIHKILSKKTHTKMASDSADSFDYMFKCKLYSNLFFLNFNLLIMLLNELK